MEMISINIDTKQDQKTSKIFASFFLEIHLIPYLS